MVPLRADGGTEGRPPGTCSLAELTVEAGEATVEVRVEVMVVEVVVVELNRNNSLNSPVSLLSVLPCSCAHHTSCASWLSSWSST